MAKGMIIDTTRCQGCRGCQSACKQWNLLPGVVTSFSATQTNPPSLNASTYNIVEFHELTDDQGDFSWHFVQRRCLHCLRPRCVPTCPAEAIIKLSNGAVVVDRELCLAWQTCECPFGRVPGIGQKGLITFDLTEGKAFKCTFCWDRQEEGLEPACARTCPPNAIEFGERDELIAQARARIQGNPDRYYDHIYGELEAGGTSIMYLTAVAPAELGLPTLGPEPLDKGQSDEEPSDIDIGTGIPWGIPAGVAGGIAALGGLLYFRARRSKGKG